MNLVLLRSLRTHFPRKGMCLKANFAGFGEYFWKSKALSEAGHGDSAACLQTRRGRPTQSLAMTPIATYPANPERSFVAFPSKTISLIMMEPT